MINITYIVPPNTYIEIRIAASIYDVTVTDTRNALITFFTVSLDGFHKTVITFPKTVPLIGGYPWWHFFVSFYGYLTYGIIAFCVIIVLIQRRSLKPRQITDTAHDLAIYKIAYQDGEQHAKQSKEQIMRRIKHLHIG
jgi:hypothetical protein